MVSPKLWSPRGRQLWVYFISAETDEDTSDQPYGPYWLVQGTYGYLRAWKEGGTRGGREYIFLGRWDERRKRWILDGEGARREDVGSEWSDFVVYAE